MESHCLVVNFREVTGLHANEWRQPTAVGRHHHIQSFKTREHTPDPSAYPPWVSPKPANSS